MATLAEIIAQNKARKDPMGALAGNVQEIVKKIASDAMQTHMKALEDEIYSEIETWMNNVTSELARQGLKGDKGDAGKDGTDAPVIDEAALFDRLVKRIPPPIPGSAGKDGKDAESVNEDALVAAVLSQVPPPVPGKDGSPDLPDEVVAKVNKASVKIRQGQVEGLSEDLMRMATNIRERAGKAGGGKGGGGMGNPQHETFAITAATTSVTTAFPIAAQGNAIFKSAYQGMALDKDMHYTVGANRKTLTFDAGVAAQFESNTIFSITYIRG